MIITLNDYTCGTADYFMQPSLYARNKIGKFLIFITKRIILKGYKSPYDRPLLSHPTLPPTNTQKEIMSMNFIFIRPLLKNKVIRGFADVSFKRHKLSLLIKVKVVSKERCWQEGHNKLQIQYQIFPLPQSIHKANWKRNLAVYRHQWALVKRNQNNEGFRHGKHFQFLSS